MPVTQIKRLQHYDIIAAFATLEPEALIRCCEKQYAHRIKKAAHQIMASGRHVVMLTGPSATGKTTTAHKLAEEIARHSIRTAVLSLDDFFVGEGKYPKNPDGTDDYECVEALDISQLHTCLKALVETGVCDAPVFDFLTQKPANQTQHIDCRDGVVIIEGLHAFNPLLTNELPENSVLNVYASLREEYKDEKGERVLATRDIRLARRMVRDWKFRGHDADFTFEIWDNVCTAEEKYIKKFKDRADMVLDTSFSDEVCLWGGLLQTLHAEKYAAEMQELRAKYAFFPQIDSNLLPQDSMLREFVGNK